MTIDKRRRSLSAHPELVEGIPQFLPVPRQTSRHDGWTEVRQRQFIEALADTGSVKAAAHRVNMTPEGAYLLRRHPEGASFRAAWEAALALGIQQLEDVAMERALHGTEVPVYSYGKLVGKRTVHNDRLLMFLLRNRAPTRFSADGRVLARQNTVGDSLKATELSRLKKQWRKEWEAERAAERHDPQATAEALNDRIERIHKSWLARMSPRTRRLYDLFEQAKDIDRQRRARHQLLRMPKDWTGSLWAEGESHPLGGVADENYRAETLGTVAEEQAEHAHHARKLGRRGKRKGRGGWE